MNHQEPHITQKKPLKLNVKLFLGLLFSGILAIAAVILFLVSANNGLFFFSTTKYDATSSLVCLIFGVLCLIGLPILHAELIQHKKILFSCACLMLAVIILGISIGIAYPSAATTKKIALSESNYKDYLSFNITYSDPIDGYGISQDCYWYMTIKTHAKRSDLEFENVTIEYGKPHNKLGLEGNPCGWISGAGGRDTYSQAQLSADGFSEATLLLKKAGSLTIHPPYASNLEAINVVHISGYVYEVQK